MRKLPVLLALLGVWALAFTVVQVPSAAAAGLPAPVADCDLHANLTRHYSISQLRHALNNIPAEISEYSNCHDIIQHQLLLQLGQLHGSGGSGSGGGSFLPTWLIVVLALLVAAAGGFGVLAVRQRRPG